METVLALLALWLFGGICLAIYTAVREAFAAGAAAQPPRRGRIEARHVGKKL